MNIKVLITELLDCNGEEVEEMGNYILSLVNKIYREYIYKHCGYMYKEDIIIESIEKIVLYKEKFKGSTFIQFKAYSKKIIISVISNYIRNVIKLDKATFVDCEDENAVEYLNNKCNEMSKIENKMINKILFEDLINSIEFSEREKKLMYGLRIYGTVKDYCQIKGENYNAAKQMFYRIKKKVKKKSDISYYEYFDAI
ncbi:hypothetical protein [Clostridium sp.]|uniref:hypothetical protein n=1 Tax=Clostridium sp. TaxID=1506 RepID=UPI003A20F76B